MAKLLLELEDDFDFVLIGISSHAKDYRLCWALNKAFDYELSKQPSLEIVRKKSVPSFFSWFNFVNDDEIRDYAIINNLSENKSLASNNNTLFADEEKHIISKSENDFLIPELKNIDFFLIIRGEIEEDEISELTQKIKDLEMVLTAKQFDAHQLKSKKNLIF
jgi:hypothetical protein